MAEKHTILGGKVYVYQRERSPVWQCSTYLDEKYRRVTTKEKSLSKAKDFAEDWYLGLPQMKSDGTLTTGQTFSQAAKRLTDEYEVMTEGERNPVYVQAHYGRLYDACCSATCGKTTEVPNLPNVPIKSIGYRGHRSQEPLIITTPPQQ